MTSHKYSQYAYRMRPKQYEVDNHLDTYDNTKLVGFDTCPTWGVMRYGHHKTLGSIGRSMPLEAGAAAHECFALMRFAELFFYYKDEPNLLWVVLEHMHKIFNDLERSAEFADMLTTPMANEHELQRRCFELTTLALDTGAFYDDIELDKRRTIANIDEAVGQFIVEFPFGQALPYVDTKTGFVGIEQPFDVVVEAVDAVGNVVQSFRFTGRIDAIDVLQRGEWKLRVGDYKTASRLDDAWQMSFDMSHQFTGYMMAASTKLGLPSVIDNGMVWGIQLPQPRSSGIIGIKRIPLLRYPHQFTEWFEWAFRVVDEFRLWKDEVHRAPKATHSCNRYFRPCPLIPYCTAPPDERKEMFDELTHDEWSPLDE